MKPLDIPHQRLRNQHLTGPGLKHPAEVVSWLVAVQAQDHAGAKWALGLRMRRAVDQTVEQAFTAGTTLRTHLMRPTWHFVSPAAPAPLAHRLPIPIAAEPRTPAYVAAAWGRMTAS